MTLAELLEPRGVEAQLYPLIKRAGMRTQDYSKRRPEILGKLYSEGYLIMPTENTQFKKAIIELVPLLRVIGRDHQILLPYNSPLKFQGESRISKLPTNKVRRYESLPQEDKTKTLGMLSEDMLRSVGLGDERVIAYDFMNSKGERNTVQLIDIIRATEMMEDSYDQQNVIDRSITKTPGKRYSAGMNAEVINIPSVDPRRREESYHAKYRHIVLADRLATEANGLSEADAALTFNIWAEDNSEKDYKIKAGYGRKTKTTDNLLISDENLLGYPSIFGYFAYQRFISETKPDLLVPDIFPNSTESFRDTYFWPLYRQTLKEEMDIETRNITISPLAIGEIEGILWGVIGYLNDSKRGKLK
jgi:hypothetical protein